MARTFWDRVAGLYDLAERTNARAVDEMVRQAAALAPAGGTLLECAAGTGAISLAAAPRCARVLCTDRSAPMLAKAEAKARRLGIGNIDFALRDLTRLPDPDGAYDMVVASNVLHLLDDPAGAVAELRRVTRPGGLTVLPTFLQGEGGAGFGVLIQLYRMLGFRSKHAYTLDSYRGLFQACGFPEAEVTRIGGRLPVGLAVLKKS